MGHRQREKREREEAERDARLKEALRRQRAELQEQRPRGRYEEVDFESVWKPFERRFRFRASIDPEGPPGIREPHPSVVLDCRRAEVGLERFLVALLRDRTPRGERLLALDWQHDSWSYDPWDPAGPPLPVLPDGDYYVHTPRDLSYGTFGHPWQGTVCLWGGELVTRWDHEGRDLAPVVRRT